MKTIKQFINKSLSRLPLWGLGGLLLLSSCTKVDLEEPLKGKITLTTDWSNYGTRISDYINNLRLNYARDLLALPSDKRTIDIIALEAGFNSRSAFFRLFKEHYGMTPLEFRRLIAGS